MPKTLPKILPRPTVQRGALAAAFAGAVLCGGIALAQSPAPADPNAARPEVPPIVTIPGQLNLTEEQRQQIRERVERDNPEVQPVPRAFAPAVGMMAPPELRLSPLPTDLRNIPGIGERHEYVMLDTGVLMIVGDRRLVTAMIGPSAREGTTGAR